MRRIPGIMLLIAVALVTAAPAHAAPLGGITIYSSDASVASATSDLAQAHALKAKVVRLEVPWRSIEPMASGQRDPAKLANLDAMVRAARARSIKLILQVDQTPCWTSTAPAAERSACTEKSASYPPADYDAYGRLAAFLTSRYHGALAAFEVWNEPDQSNERYWAGPDKVVRYAALVRATYPAVKAADASLPVLAGTVVGTNGAFLSALYDAGMKGYYDGISVHFYDLPLLGLRQTRAVQRAHGDSKPLWLLETGWNSCAPAKRGTEGQPCVTTTVQATDLLELYGQLRQTTYVKAVVVYKLRDEAVDRFGVLASNGRRKPAFAALQRAFSGSRLSVHRPVLRLRRGTRSVIASGSGPDGDAYQINVRRAGRLVYRANFRMTSSNHFSLVLPAVLGRSGLSVKLTQLWRGASTSRKI